MNILGISAFNDDAACVLLRDGVPLAAAPEERFSRQKRDGAFPKRAIRACLRQGRLEAKDLDWVVFYEKPLKRFERTLITHMREFPRSARSFSKSMFLWLGDRIWIKNRIAADLGVDFGKILFTEHHQAHAASAFFPSPFDKAAILTVGGVGEWATTAMFQAEGSNITKLSEIQFPHCLGTLCSAVSSFLGLSPHESDKVAALAAYGEAKYVQEMRSLIHFEEDGSFALDLEAFPRPLEVEHLHQGLADRLGPPRPPREPMRYLGQDRRDADLAKSLQVVIEEALLNLVRELHKRFPCDNLCLAGELAANTSANSRLLEDGPFSNLFIQPAIGDSGCALGAALHVQHVVENKPRDFRQEHAFLGEQVLDRQEEGATELLSEDDVVDAIVDRLVEGQLVGIVRGRFEWGPRSLGHRSILADPRGAMVRERLDRGIKPREGFRPFAPAVLEEKASDYFELPGGGSWPLRFMQLSVKAKSQTVEKAPSVVHEDGRSRIQSVDAATNPFLHRVLTAFEAKTGWPMLLNTSLNGRGDPIVRGETEALELFKRSDLDALVVENRLYASA